MMKACTMRIGFFGAGKMAEGILSAMPDRSSVIVSDVNPARLAEIAKTYGVAATGDVREVAKSASLIFLAVRPQDAATVAEAVKPVLKAGQTIVSIVAGKRLAVLRRLFGRKPGLVRVMPNLALRAKAGMCAICAPKGTPPKAVKAVRDILSAAGEAVVLPEKDFDAVTALSGSGPAYFAYMEEAMAEAGVALGLKPAAARLLAEQTMYGTAKFLRESGMPLRPFIEGVCTKGGTTAAGMAVMDASDLKRVVAGTLKAAAERSRELA